MFAVLTLLPRGPRTWRLAAGLLAAWSASLTFAAEERAPGPLESEFPVATVSALLRPAATQRLIAPVSRRFHRVAAPGPVAAGDVIGRFEDAELRAALVTTGLRLRAARQQEADFVADAPTRRQEAMTRLSDLAGRLAMAEAVVKNPALLHELPAAVQVPLLHADPAGLRAQLDAARGQLARLDAPGSAETSTSHLQVLEAERTVREAQTALRDATLTAPMAGVYQPSPVLAAAAADDVPLAAGQEIGSLRDLTHLVAAVPAASPYLVRVDLARTVLQIDGPGGQKFRAPFRAAVTEASPVMGEARMFLYEFSPTDSHALGELVLTNVNARIVLRSASSLAVVAKLSAALDHPGEFRDGWAAGVARVWPGWTLVCEGEVDLGLARAQP
jgi:hypothetical protein